MTLLKDVYIPENNEKLKSDEKVLCSDLDILVPKHVKRTIGNYNFKMKDSITTPLDKR
jgi:hypothetical protein